jgi:hypothetical protein
MMEADNFGGIAKSAEGGFSARRFSITNILYANWDVL